MTLTVVFDNYPGPPELETGWGFGCYVELPQTTVLFDTGASGSVLIDNMLALDLDPEAVDLIVLSHRHGDHVGGLREVLSLAPDATVCVLDSFPGEIKRVARAAGATLVEAEPGQQLAEGVFTTGAIPGPPPEQALVLKAAAGLVVVTGCAHPGVDRMVEVASQQHGGQVELVFGGFHLTGASRGSIERIARSLQEMSVNRAGPCHCSGDTAREVFAEIFGDRYVDVHVGTRFELPLPGEQ
ncbi:MAG: MBL fold metallo-hydrolase [Armatimonadota bacterium]